MADTTINPLGLTYPSARGDDVEWADGYEANLAILNNVLGNGYKKNVITGTYEATQNDVEYYDGFHGSAQLYYMKKTGTTAAARDTILVSSFGVDNNIPIEWGGCVVAAGGDSFTYPGYLSSGGLGGLWIQTNDLKLANGSSFYSSTYEVWFRYTKK
jgi:hypothetical protein